MVEEMCKKGEFVNFFVYIKFEDDDDEGQNDVLEEDVNEVSYYLFFEELGISDSESDSGFEVVFLKVCLFVLGFLEYDFIDLNLDGDDDLSSDEDENNEEV